MNSSTPKSEVSTKPGQLHGDNQKLIRCAANDSVIVNMEQSFKNMDGFIKSGEMYLCLRAGDSMAGSYSYLPSAGEEHPPVEPSGAHAHLFPRTISSGPMLNDAHDRIISISVAVLSLVLGVLPLIGFVVSLVVRTLQHEPGIPSVLILFFAVGLIGISLSIFRALKRGQVFHWLGGGALNYLLLLLIVVLSAMIQAETTVIERLMVRRLGVGPKLANLLALLPVILGALVFAFYLRKASAARVSKESL